MQRKEPRNFIVIVGNNKLFLLIQMPMLEDISKNQKRLYPTISVTNSCELVSFVLLR